MNPSVIRSVRSLAMVGILAIVTIALSDSAVASCGSYLHTRFSSPTGMTTSRYAALSAGRHFNDLTGVGHIGAIGNEPFPMTKPSAPIPPCDGPGCRQHSVPLSTPPLAVNSAPEVREADCFVSGDTAAERSLLYQRRSQSPVHAKAGHPQPIEIPPEA
ncbi:MAG: hypothetical protein JNM43_04625 [Planctomycetaceae bacterium]|nr:hypothetical protein [Planctomycetaceae bacterium]